MAALRETSIVCATAIGVLLFHEKTDTTRLALVALIAAGRGRSRSDRDQPAVGVPVPCPMTIMAMTASTMLTASTFHTMPDFSAPRASVGVFSSWSLAFFMGSGLSDEGSRILS